jgi:predicted DCC family thiol-disulfide oxidoreductase YuxK
MSHDLILYDGECGLCAGVVQFVLPRDRDDRFRFAALQGAIGQAELARHGLPADRFDSVVVIVGHGGPAAEARVKGAAARHIAAALGGAWRLLAVLRVVPRPILDALYDGVARYRIAWFGRVDHCLVPAPHLRRKLLG